MAIPEFHAFIARVNELLSYDPETGEFRWKVGRPGASKGSLAGGLRPDGYRKIRVDRRQVLAHRLAFMIAHGRDPVGEIDHVNRVKSDNRLANLREATKSQNGANKQTSRRAPHGLKGISRAKPENRWRACIRKDGKFFHLGVFDTPEAAHAAYVDAARRLHGEFARSA